MSIERFAEDLAEEFKEYVACGRCEIVPSFLPNIYSLYLTWRSGVYVIYIEEELKNKILKISITKLVLPEHQDGQFVLPEHQDGLSAALLLSAAEKEVGTLHVASTANGPKAVIRHFIESQHALP
jgi:hypothetical protein